MTETTTTTADVAPPSLTSRLRAGIVDGTYAPGERLVELQLTERFGEGRAAVRSALVELEKEGLVVRETNRGATVRRTSIAEAIQITEARSALESLVARHAARRASTADRRELRRIVDDMRRAVADGEPVTYSRLNERLHRRLQEIAGHDVATDLVRNLRHRAAAHQFRLSSMPGRSAESLPQHAAIVDAVVAADEDAAAAAMTAHLESVLTVLRHWQALG